MLSIYFKINPGFIIHDHQTDHQTPANLGDLYMSFALEMLKTAVPIQ